MANYSTNELKNGLKVMIDGAPCVILDCDFVKPGKGQAFTRVKIRNLKTHRTVDRTYKSGEVLESADVMDTDMQYLYHDGEHWHFMRMDTFEQYTLPDAIAKEASIWLKPQDICTITLWNNEPLSVYPPNFVVLQIIETDPGVRGDTSGGGGKPATLETGAVVRVPLFIQKQEWIKVDTRTGEYVARASKTDSAS